MVVYAKQVSRAIADQARTIRIPIHMIETINRINKIIRKHLQEYRKRARFRDNSLKKLVYQSIRLKM